MTSQLPTAGAASEELCRNAHRWWIDGAGRSGIDLDGFDPEAPLEQRVAWAQTAGLETATTLSRYSSKLQHSTEAQIQQNVEFAAGHQLYVPPEYICVDEGIKGRRQRRDGLDRVKNILKDRLAGVLLVFKLSRLMRVGYKGFQFVQENVVDEGLRAISTSQGIDTRDKDSWKCLTYLHGMMDDLLLDTIADHCRAGLVRLHLDGFVVGALTVGYDRVEVPGAPKTKRGLPRTRPAINAQAERLIQQHFQWIRDGMAIREGWRRWIDAGGPRDPRSSSSYMSYPAYRRMLSNRRYTGLWGFGRTRSRWSSKRDYTQQIQQPETDVKVYQCEELRIVSDELFFAVQERLGKLTKGPHKRRQDKPLHLWDLTTSLFYCAHCDVRFYQTGAQGNGMQCKHDSRCPSKSAVRRKEAVQAVCQKLQQLIEQDSELLHEILQRAQTMDACGDEQLQEEISRLQRSIGNLTGGIGELSDLVLHGSDEDRAEMRGKIRAAQAERATQRSKLEGLRQRVEQSEPISPERVRDTLADVTSLLQDAANGRLGEDVVYKALSVFRQLVGERIWVHVERRPARKQTNVRGVFRPNLLRAVQSASDRGGLAVDVESPEVEVWLRQPPMRDRLAPRAHQLIDIDGLSFRAAEAVFRAEGHDINSGVVWQIYHRYYEMIGQRPPDRPYNNGRPRNPA